MKREMDIICDAFSSQRLGKYMRLYDGDEAKVVAHYYTELPKPEELQLIIKRQMIIAQQGNCNIDE